MKKTFEILPPTMPNYVRFKKEPRLKQESLSTEEGFDVADFTEEEAREFAELMRITFIRHYIDRKANRK